MIKMRKTTFSILLILFISSLITPIFPILISTARNFDRKQSEVSNLNTSALTEINTTIIIDDLPGSPLNWTWAKDQGYCTGLGTAANPYVISGKFFNTSLAGYNSLTIIDSRKHFIVRNCEFKGHSQFAGIELANTTNGVITGNMMHPNTGALVWVYNSSANVIRSNNASYGSYYGVLIDSAGGISRDNVVTDNVIAHNYEAGVQIRIGSIFNTISDNNFSNNTLGIDVNAYVTNNTIRGNVIRNSYLSGVLLNTLSEYNYIYENCFITNSLHAIDNGLKNFWDNGAKGNYWDNYTGSDANNDGIGDIPYNITGGAGSQDLFPLMNCPAPSTPSGIPGYSLFIVFIVGIASIIGIIVIRKKKILNA